MSMVEVKTSDLIGPALDWAVAEAVGWKPQEYRDGMLICSAMPGDEAVASPSSDWSQGGPLIEKYHVQTSFNGCGFSRSPTGKYWCAYACKDSGEEMRPSGGGPTPLIAACRAIVAAKLGDTVQIPQELMP